jgi:hypothetical protein
VRGWDIVAPVRSWGNVVSVMRWDNMDSVICSYSAALDNILLGLVTTNIDNCDVLCTV